MRSTIVLLSTLLSVSLARVAFAQNLVCEGKSGDTRFSLIVDAAGKAKAIIQKDKSPEVSCSLSNFFFADKTKEGHVPEVEFLFNTTESCPKSSASLLYTPVRLTITPVGKGLFEASLELLTGKGFTKCGLRKFDLESLKKLYE